MPQRCWHFTQKDTNPSWLIWCLCLLPLFPFKKQITSSKGAWKKHLPVPGHWLRNSHRRAMKTWAHCTVSSTHNLRGILAISLKTHCIICIMQRSARGFLRGTKTSFCTCPNHSLIGSVEWRWGQGLAWAGNTPGTSLHQIHLISFCVQQTQQNESFHSGFPLAYRKQSKGRKKELEGFIISVALFSAFLPLLSTVGNAAAPTQDYWPCYSHNAIPTGPVCPALLARDLEIQNCNWH